MEEKLTAGDLARRLKVPVYKVADMIEMGCPCTYAETEGKASKTEPMFDWGDVEAWLQRRSTEDTVFE